MRSPSSRVLANTVNIFVGQNSVDTDGGPTWIYPSAPTYANVPCSVQATDFDMVVDDQERVVQIYSYKVIFGARVSVTPRDQIIWVDKLGFSHTLFFKAQRDNAGRGGAYTIRAEERV